MSNGHCAGALRAMANAGYFDRKELTEPQQIRLATGATQNEPNCQA